MKNLITRRVTILMFITIFFSSIIVAVLSLLFSEEMRADYRSKEFIPDLSVVTECTIQYQDGNLSKDTYGNILINASKEHIREYIVVNTEGTVIFNTGGTINLAVKAKIEEALENILRGNQTYQKLYESAKIPISIVGVPVIENNESTGAIFVLIDMSNLLQERKKFFYSIIISMIIVIPFGVGFSYLVLKRIVKPIRNVVKVALSMVEGDFSIRADETLKGEIGLLGRTINKLSISLYKNISELYIEKNRLYQVLNSLEEGMIAVDENRCITHFNRVFLEMFELTEDEIKGKCIDNIDFLSEELYELSQAIEGKYSIIKNCAHHDIIMRVVIASIEDEKNISVGAVVLFRDITELEKLETMRKDYVANVSHELRSPLTSIRGLIEPLMDSIVTNEEDVKRYYEIIYKESLRLSRLVDDIMELSRLQTNDAAIEKTSVNLNSIIEMVVERFKILDEDINLIYNTVVLPRVYTNYDRIEQVLVILLDNAYKFTPKGGQLEILTEVRAKDILVTVKDTGVGIEGEDLPFIFDRFYKSDKSRSKRGTGLGLSIAKEILFIMGEEINVKSEQGFGSSFEFTVHLEIYNK